MSEMNELRVFTVAEANRLIPRLSELIEEIKKTRDVILALEVEIDALELIAGKDTKQPSSPAHKKLEEYNRAVDRFYRLIDDIHGLGCFLKDMDVGLVDFYTKYEGRIVYLCWKMGESEIHTWHEVGRGYTYRQPLERTEDGRESSG